jgi:peptidoglycan-associated lipoprotein
MTLSSLTHSRRSLSAILLLAAASLATGCHKKTNPINPNALGPTTPEPAPTASITADPLAIDLGGTVVLNWRTMNATSVSIDGIGQVNVNGTQTVSPSNSTNFHLIARGDGGTTEANVRVTVRVPTAAPVGATTMDTDNADATSDAAFHAAVQDVFFGYDSFEITGDAQTAVSQAANYLVQHPGIKILIGGYCDERGSAEYNLALGQNRANAAKTALVSAGIAPARIRTISYGKEKQFCTEATESCWQQNRRAQFTIDR